MGPGDTEDQDTSPPAHPWGALPCCVSGHTDTLLFPEELAAVLQDTTGAGLWGRRLSKETSGQAGLQKGFLLSRTVILLITNELITKLIRTPCFGGNLMSFLFSSPQFNKLLVLSWVLETVPHHTHPRSL